MWSDLMQAFERSLDRLIAAARYARAKLVTADGVILGWEGKVERLDAEE